MAVHQSITRWIFVYFLFFAYSSLEAAALPSALIGPPLITTLLGRSSGTGPTVYVTSSDGKYLLTQNAGGSYVTAGNFTGDCDNAGGCWTLGVDDTTTVSIVGALPLNTEI